MTMPESLADRVDDFFSQYPERTYPKGQILIFADEDPGYIYYLKKGRVRVYDVSYKGDEVIVNIFKTGAYFPMSWAINKQPNRYFYKTEGDTTLHMIPPAEVIAFIKTNPDIMLDLLSRLYSGLEGLLERQVRLMSGSAKERLVYEIILECRRFGIQDKNTYSLDISEVELAARSGLSRETVSREIHKLKLDGLIRISKSKLIVADYSLLQQKIYPNS